MSKTERVVRVLTGDELWAANCYACEHIAGDGRTAQYLNYGALRSIIDHNDPLTSYPVAYHFMHGDRSVRAVIVLDSQGHLGVVDLELNYFAALPTMTVALDEERIEDYVRTEVPRDRRYRSQVE